MILVGGGRCRRWHWRGQRRGQWRQQQQLERQQHRLAAATTPPAAAAVRELLLLRWWLATKQYRRTPSTQQHKLYISPDCWKAVMSGYSASKCLARGFWLAIRWRTTWPGKPYQTAVAIGSANPEIQVSAMTVF